MLQIQAALFYYKLGQTLLQIRAAITNWEQNLLQIRAVIANWGITHVGICVSLCV